MAAGAPKPQIDTSRPHSARVYDWLLGGKDHYAVDAELGRTLPALARPAAVQNRAFMHRTVAFLAHQGIDQFLDIGTGIPTEPNLHQIAQSINPKARIVYTDNDPIVLRHGEALLISTPEGATHYVEADVHTPEAVLEHAREHLDFDRPIALSLIGLLHFLPDGDDPHGVLRTLLEALPSGSHLVLSQGASDLSRDVMRSAADGYSKGGISVAFRTRDEFARFFSGLELVEPGIVTAPEWFREEPTEPSVHLALYGAVGRKP
jgi:O-methyltransferase involved in polyketide biosynthesis